MLELGSEAAALHREVGEAAAARVDHLILLGEMAAETAAGARAAEMPPERVQVVSTHEEAAAFLLGLLKSGDRLLVKGSRGMRMEKVCAALKGNESLPAGH
jgi:UDP-N-acetylmuramoyl-tripeptide--D-alanyl-D-alanine ligase